LHDKGCAILVQTNDKQDFTIAIENLIGDPRLVKELGSNGYKVIQKSFTKEHVVAQYVDLLESL
ncbi:MAG: glycosyltransferase, partial [Bacteroidota bacterium]